MATKIVGADVNTGALPNIVRTKILEDTSTNAANPESSLNNAIVSVATDVIGGGVGGLMKIVDARGNSGTARPVGWTGSCWWLINFGQSDPINVVDGDMVGTVGLDPVVIPWTPAALPSLAIWYDAQTLPYANNATVASWPDLSGNGHDVIQATEANKPLFKTSGINGHPAVVADGVNDSLAAAVISPALTGVITLFVVASSDVVDVVTSSDAIFGSANSAAAVLALDLYRDISEKAIGRRGGVTITGTAALFTPGKHLFKFVMTAAGTSLYQDGVQVGSTGASSIATDIAALRLFARYDAANFWNGALGEFILVNGAVSTEDETKLNTYLARWDA